AAICDQLPAVRKDGGVQAMAERYRTSRSIELSFMIFFRQPYAVILKHGFEVLGRVPLEAEHGTVICRCLRDPLVAVSRPVDRVSPPLVSDLVRHHEPLEQNPAELR